MIRSASCLAVLALACPSLHAQGVLEPCLPYLPMNIASPGNNPDPEFGNWNDLRRVIALDMDGDQATDAVVLAGTVPVFLPKPATYSIVAPMKNSSGGWPSNVSDIAVLPGASSNGWDTVLATTPAGLSKIEYDAPYFVETAFPNKGAFANAKGLCVHDLDGDGDLDVYAHVGSSLVLSQNNGTTLDPPLVVPMGSAVVESFPIQWGPSGTLIAVLTTEQLVVRNIAGTTSISYSALNAPGRIARVAMGGVEVIAWSRTPSGGNPELVLRGYEYSVDLGALYLWNCSSNAYITPTALVAGLWDDDNDEDLLIVHEGSGSAFVLKNQGILAALPFDPSATSTYETIPLGLTTTPDVGIPAFTQLDGWGPDDLIFPIGDLKHCSTFTELPYEIAIPEALKAPGPSAIPQDETEWQVLAIGDAELRFAIKVPTSVSNRSHIEVIVWQETFDGSVYTVHIGAIGHAVYPLAQSGGAAAQFQYVTVTSLPDDWQTEMYHYLEFRLLDWDGSQATNTTPFYFGGLALGDETSGCETHLLNQPSAGGWFRITDLNGVSGYESGRNYVGAYVKMSDEPDFESGVPNPGPIDNGDEGVPYTPVN